MFKTTDAFNNCTKSNGVNTTLEVNQFPLYPDFNDKTAEVNVDMIQDWIAILLQENRDRIENVDDTFLLFVDPRSVEYLFTICLRMRLPHDVKYIALAIFSEFMTAHVSDLYAMIADLPDRTNEQKAKEWERVESTISRQLSLRVVSCIQIASKIHCYNESLSTKRVRRALQFLGQAYTEDAVRRSELRILMTLNFNSKLRHTPVVYVESVLSVFNKFYKDLSATRLWEYSLLFLDVVYLQLDDVYRRILQIIHGNDAICLTKDRVRRLQADYMLLAVGVIAMACLSLYGKVFADKATDTIARISKIPVADIRDVSTGIVKAVLEYRAVSSTIISSSTGGATAATLAPIHISAMENLASNAEGSSSTNADK